MRGCQEAPVKRLRAGSPSTAGVQAAGFTLLLQAAIRRRYAQEAPKLGGLGCPAGVRHTTQSGGTGAGTCRLKRRRVLSELLIKHAALGLWLQWLS